MTLNRQLLRSFAGGEITPEMFGRIDLGKNQTGLQLARNFITTPHGPARRRPGFFYGASSKGSTYGIGVDSRVQLVPFVFAADQAVVLELGDHYLRFHNSSGTLLEATANVVGLTNANPGVFYSPALDLQTGDAVFLTYNAALGDAFYIVTRIDIDHFTLTTTDGAVVNTSAMPAYAGGATVARVYEIATPYPVGTAFTFAQNSDVLTITSLGFPAQELKRQAATVWTLTPATFAPTTPTPTGVAVVATVAQSSNLTTASYVVTAVAADLVSESTASAVVTATNNLGLAGNYNTISWSAVAGANRYYVYKLRGGAYGYIGQTTSLTIRDDNILPDTTVVPPEANITLNDQVGAYPSTVTYYEQRRYFAGTLNNPQTIWATRSATESNLTASIPSRDDDAIQFRIAAQQQNAIRHLLPLTDLMALTAGGEFRIFADGAPAITPSTLSIKPQGYTGSATVMPALTASSILYVQAQGSRVRELAYDSSGTGAYRSIDITLLAPHLFDGFKILSMAYTRAPDQVLWCVRSDGVLLGLSYVPDQQVYGWHQHVTNGSFESVTVIPENGEDVLYAVVARSYAGAHPRTVRNIERLHSRIFTDAADAFFVDSGLTYDGAPKTVLTGLWHLEGQLVDILADGAVVAPQTVAGGTITLDTAASTVQVGLNYVSDMQTLPMTVDNLAAGGQGVTKNVNKLKVRVAQSSLVSAGPSLDKLVDYPARLVTDHYDSPPSLRNAEFSLTLSPSWNTDGAFYIRQDRPLPLTVCSIVPEVATGG